MMIEIIPAIDLIDGKCVRLEQGDYRLKKVYDRDPLDVAKSFEDTGIRRLHVVDLDGARDKQVVNWRSLEKIAGKTSLVIDFGGGIKKHDDLRIVFECGAAMAVIGSVAVSDRELFSEWLDGYGPERIILGADVRDRKIAVSGWEENTDIDIMQFIEEFQGLGVRQVLCTDIAKDGMLKGPSIDLYREIHDRFPEIMLIASGGVTAVDDLEKLQDAGIPAAIIGKAIYEGKIKLSDLKQFLPSC